MVLAMLISLPGGCVAVQTPAQQDAAQIVAPVWNVGDEWEYRYEQPSGSGTFVRSLVRTETIDGVKHIVMRQGSREAFFRRDDGALTQETVAGSVVSRYRPANILVSYPLFVGKRWERIYTEERPLDRQTEGVSQICVAEAKEMVTLPAGTFDTIRVVCTTSRTGVEAYRLWYSPDVRYAVRVVSQRSGGPLTLELIAAHLAPVPSTASSSGPPGAVPPSLPGALGPTAAPVWKVGDEWQYAYTGVSGSGTYFWSVDRIQMLDGVEHYVIKGGTREIFYRVSDLAHTLERVRGVIVVRETPSRTSYSWPLVIGKNWEQNYRREAPVDRQTSDEAARWAVESEETVTVPAGTFHTLKITWRNRNTNALIVEMWYAPAVKQFVKERAVLSGGIRERELIFFKLN
jgi:hypothetical protein